MLESFGKNSEHEQDSALDKIRLDDVLSALAERIQRCIDAFKGSNISGVFLKMSDRSPKV